MDVSCSPVLGSLTARERDRLLDRAVERRLDAGDVLYFAGESGDRIHLVVRGILKLSGRTADGSETVLGVVTDPELLGVVSALDRDDGLDVTAVAPAHVVGFDGGLFVDVIGGNARASLELARECAAGTRIARTIAVERSADRVARLAGRILDLAELLGRVRGDAIELDLPLAQGDLGSYAGMCRETTCKTLRRFRERGLVDYRGRRLRILRPDVLDRIRCAGRGATPSR